MCFSLEIIVAQYAPDSKIVANEASRREHFRTQKLESYVSSSFPVVLCQQCTQHAPDNAHDLALQHAAKQCCKGECAAAHFCLQMQATHEAYVKKKQISDED